MIIKKRRKMETTTKYPRTPHLPFSPGLKNDDRMVETGWESIFDNTLVLTEKMDGGNGMLCREACYDRSHGAPTRNPWSRNLWDVGGLHDQLKNKIGVEEYLYGENMYGIHSIVYDHLPSYFFLFGVRSETQWYSWEEVELVADLFQLPTVPVLEIGKFSGEEELKERILYHMTQGSRYGNTIEGVVVRNINGYPVNEFDKNVVKYVRKGHVQTDQHWARSWKKAELKF